MKIRAMIAEDEPLAQAELAYLIGLQPDFELCPSANDGADVIPFIEKYHPDVVFLDIAMPSVTGLEVARFLSQQRHGNHQRSVPLVVFTTAYDEYALQAFTVEAIDYLLKPYHQERFAATIERIRQRCREVGVPTDRSDSLAGETEKAGDGIARIDDDSTRNSTKVSKMLFEHGDSVVVVDPISIQYALRTERHVEVHTERDVLTYRGTLSELETKLSGWLFFRPHRSYLVNLNYVHEITPWLNGAYTIIMSDKEHTNIPVSRAAAKELFHALSR